MNDGGWQRKDPNSQALFVGMVATTAILGTVFAIQILPESFAWNCCCGTTLLLMLGFTAMVFFNYVRVNAWHKDYKPSPSKVREFIEDGFRVRGIAYERRKTGSPEGFTAPECAWEAVLTNTKVYVKISDRSTFTRVYVGPDDPASQPLIQGIRKVIDESMDGRRA
ncbi:MAG: hypothetical protein V1934_00805 [Methanobacteriota archaeon]